MRTILLTVLCVLPSTSYADRDAAKLFFAEGQAAFDRQDYEAARAAFERAYKEYPVSALALNVALARYNLDQPYAARSWLRRYYQMLQRDEKASPAAEILSRRIVEAIDEDYNALGLRFGCDPRKGVCFVGSRWNLVAGAITP